MHCLLSPLYSRAGPKSPVRREGAPFGNIYVEDNNLGYLYRLCTEVAHNLHTISVLLSATLAMTLMQHGIYSNGSWNSSNTGISLEHPFAPCHMEIYMQGNLKKEEDLYHKK